MALWTKRLKYSPNEDIPYEINEHLPPGYSEDRATWVYLNRLRVGVARTRMQIRRWFFFQMRRASDAHVERRMKQCRTYLSPNLWGILCLALISRHITRRLGGACWRGGTWCDWHDEEKVHRFSWSVDIMLSIDNATYALRCLTVSGCCHQNVGWQDITI